MKVNNETADKIWKHCFGNAQSGTDPFGFKVIRNKHGMSGHGGWTVDHVWPKSGPNNSRGANTYSNTQVLSDDANRIKSNNMQGKINGVTYAVVKLNTISDYGYGNETYEGRMKIKIVNDWYWAYGPW